MRAEETTTEKAETKTGFMQSIRPIIKQLTLDGIARDGEAYLDYLSEQTKGPVGITGYCMGARVGWRIP